MIRDNITHNLGVLRFTGAGILTREVKGPPGKRGWLLDVGIRVTEEFVADETTAKIRVGTVADPDHYAELEIPDGAEAGTVVNTVDGRTAITGEKLPADTAVVVSFVNAAAADIEEVEDPPAQAQTNRSAGAGEPYLVIGWY
jgi:hypothetical protein